MPKDITIHNIPDEVYKKLKQQAELHKRSINDQIILYLKQMAGLHRPDPDLIIARAKKLKQQAKGSLSMQYILRAIRQGRP